MAGEPPVINHIIATGEGSDNTPVGQNMGATESIIPHVFSFIANYVRNIPHMFTRATQELGINRPESGVDSFGEVHHEANEHEANEHEGNSESVSYTGPNGSPRRKMSPRSINPDDLMRAHEAGMVIASYSGSDSTRMIHEDQNHADPTSAHAHSVGGGHSGEGSNPAGSQYLGGGDAHSGTPTVTQSNSGMQH